MDGSADRWGHGWGMDGGVLLSGVGVRCGVGRFTYVRARRVHALLFKLVEKDLHTVDSSLIHASLAKIGCQRNRRLSPPPLHLPPALFSFPRR